MLRTRFISLFLISAMVLLGSINNDVIARGLGKIKQTTATVAAEIINCNLEEEWCSKGPYVLITGDDPAYSILSINGSTNGKVFQYDGKICSIPLNVGTNNLIFWSISSSGLTSEKKYLTINLNTSQTRLLINFDLTRKTEASLLPGRQLLVDGGNDLKDVHFMNPTGLPFDSAYYPAGTLSSIDTSSSPLTEADKPASQSNIHQWILIAKGSLLPFQFNSDEKNNSSDETLTKSKAEPPAVQANSSAAKDSMKISAYIFSHFLRRNINSQKELTNLQNLGEEYNLVLDILPPSLNILPQQSVSGTLTFEGNTSDDASGINSLMVNVGQGWLPVRLENNHWTYQWNTEKAGISGGVFDLQVRVEDSAGNQQIQTQRITVLNRIWPVLSLCGLLLSLGITTVLDPRRKAWSALAHITARAARVNAMDSPKEKR